MKHGICYCYWSKDWEGSDYPSKIERARRCGFDVLEIFFGRILSMGEVEKREIAAACRANDVEIYCLGGFGRDMDISDPDPENRQNAVEKCKELLDAVNSIGAKNFSGINYGAWCNFDKPEQKAMRLEYAALSLGEIGKYAGDYGISWNMEVVNRFESYLLNTAEEAVALAERSGSPFINILLDSFHGMLEEDSLSDAIRTAGSRLGHYHIGANNRKLPAPGLIPWEDIMQALKDIGYEKTISFEPLVHTGGTVALNGGSVWRPMLPEGADDKYLDDKLKESLEFIRGIERKVGL